MLLPRGWLRWLNIRAARSGGTLDEARDRLAATVLSGWLEESAVRRIADNHLIPIRWRVRGAGPEVELGPDGLAQKFRAMPQRRLVILGEAGSGKTTLAMLLMRELLLLRAGNDPVPVMLPMATWNPDVPLTDWLTDRLEAAYPWLSSPQYGGSAARTLIRRGRVLPILDGLDEIPMEPAANALRALSAKLMASDPVVITCRTTVYRSLVPSSNESIMGATVVPTPLTTDVITGYLRRALPPDPGPGWDSLFDTLDHEPDHPISRVLRIPLWLTSVRQSYAGPGPHDPAPLCDRARFPTSDAITDHLLRRSVATTSPGAPGAPRAGRRARRPARTSKYLANLARHLDRIGGRDIVWSQLWRSLPASLNWVAGGLLGGVLSAVAITAYLLAWAGLDPVSNPSLLLLLVVGTGAYWGARALSDPWYTPARLGWAIRIDAAFAVSTAVVVTAWMIGRLPGGVAKPGSALAIGFLMGVLYLLGAPSMSYLVAVTILAIRGQFPLRLQAFLRYAEEADILRQAGEAYQFRHQAVQESYAAAGTRSAAPAPQQIDQAGRAKIVEEVLVLRELSLRPGGDRPLLSHNDISLIAMDLLTDNLRHVEQSAADHYDRFVGARNLLIDAARLPWWSRWRLTQLATWVAGTLAAWAAVTKWPPPDAVWWTALVVVLAILLIAAITWVALPNSRGPAISAAIRNVLRRPPLYLLATALAAGLTLSSAPNENVLTALVIVAAVVWLVMFPLWWNSAPYIAVRKVQPAADPADWPQLPSQLIRYRVAAEQAYRDWIAAMAREGLMPLLRARLGETPETDLTTTLPQLDPSRLSGLSRAEEFIETGVSRQLEMLIANLSSASIGLSGSRGAGKSTLLRRLCTTELPGAEADLRMLVHAPTAYDPREFITHLFIQVCEKLTDDGGPQPSQPSRQARMFLRRHMASVVTAAGVALIAGTLLLRPLRDLLDWLAERPPRTAFLAGWGLLLGGFGVNMGRARQARRRQSSGAARSAAYAHLISLRYLQATTHTQLGELTLPGGVKLGRQAAVQRTEQRVTYPQLVADFRELLELVALERRSAGGKVIIGIDELDKIASAEDAERFLNDLKAVFGVRDCYFLVALSEDALAAFERRRLAIRNTFDSAFDKIIHVRPLRSDESRSMLTRRGVPLPVPYLWLCHALTGGLPRDLLRTVLDVAVTSTQHEDRQLPSLAAELIRQDLDTVLATQLREAAQLPAGATELTQWLAKCTDCTVTAAAIDTLVTNAPTETADISGRPLVIQTCAYLSVIAVLTAIFVDGVDRCADWLADQPEPHPLDRVAEARSLIAVDPNLAWHTVAQLRQQIHSVDGV